MEQDLCLESSISQVLVILRRLNTDLLAADLISIKNKLNLMLHHFLPVNVNFNLTSKSDDELSTELVLIRLIPRCCVECHCL